MPILPDLLDAYTDAVYLYSKGVLPQGIYFEVWLVWFNYFASLNSEHVEIPRRTCPNTSFLLARLPLVAVSDFPSNCHISRWLVSLVTHIWALTEDCKWRSGWALMVSKIEVSSARRKCWLSVLRGVKNLLVWEYLHILAVWGRERKQKFPQVGVLFRKWVFLSQLSVFLPALFCLQVSLLREKCTHI